MLRRLGRRALVLLVPVLIVALRAHGGDDDGCGEDTPAESETSQPRTTETDRRPR